MATEVKTLASQTAKATEEIGAQIQEMQGATGRVATSIDAIGTIIRRMSENAAAISAAVEQQGAATKEIARNVAQAAVGTQQVSSNIAGVTEAATQTGAGATQVLSSSAELAREAETLKAKVDGFLRPHPRRLKPAAAAVPSGDSARRSAAPRRTAGFLRCGSRDAKSSR